MVLRNVAAMIHRHDTVTNTTCAVEWNHPPTCHPDRNEMEWRDLPKLQTLPYAGYSRYLGRFLHSACAQGLNDIPERWFCLSTQVVFATSPGTAHRPFPTVSLVGGSIQPYRLYPERSGRQDCRPYMHIGKWYHSTVRVLFGAPPLHAQHFCAVSPTGQTGFLKRWG